LILIQKEQEMTQKPEYNFIELIQKECRAGQQQVRNCPSGFNCQALNRQCFRKSF